MVATITAMVSTTRIDADVTAIMYHSGWNKDRTDKKAVDLNPYRVATFGEIPAFFPICVSF